MPDRFEAKSKKECRKNAMAERLNLRHKITASKFKSHTEMAEEYR